MKIGNVVPDVSLGSRFFNDLVEANMLYLALHPSYPAIALRCQTGAVAEDARHFTGVGPPGFVFTVRPLSPEIVKRPERARAGRGP